MATHTPMSIENASGLIRLMTWMSPAFPIGGFSYSHGLEAAIASKLIADREALLDWVKSLITSGSVYNDCIVIAAACQAADEETISELAQLAEALAGSNERHLETMSQGSAFIKAANQWLPDRFSAEKPMPLPVALGIVGQHNDIDTQSLIIAYLQSFTSNQIQAALRLMPLGQTNGLWVQRKLEAAIMQSAQRASNATLEDLGASTITAEIVAMQHETLHSRIFRT